MKNKYTIQDIFIQYGDNYVNKHNLSKEQWKVFNAIRNCGTKELGYHICTCEECGEEYFGYNSCRNRHCPMCQNYAREKWIQKESSYLLNSKYFHIVTTVPYELNKIFLYNKKICYNILFKATSESILTLTEDPKWLGAKVGITSLLHTWGQTMEFHPHIHSIVTGGGLKNNKWITCNKDYLFKVQVLGSLFKGKFLYYLKQEFNNLNLNESLKNIKSFNKFLEPLYQKTWITYIEPPKGKVENIIARAISEAKWCAADPVCIQSTGQGQYGCNLAACHNCALLPETSCENKNMYLDRGLLIGTLDDNTIGYFSNYEED